MIEQGIGNLLESEVEALVNTVNTVGVMGKGVALQFKQAFPENFRAYKRACDHDQVKLGEMFVFDSGELGPRRYIINFPTKQHWRGKSQLADIEHGLDDLVRVLQELAIESVAIPALGCGNGGLDWSEVLPLITSKLDDLRTRCVVFPPAGAPDPRTMPIATAKPAMTRGRAVLLALIGRYAHSAMRDRLDLVRPGASLLEIQKLMFLLQEAGTPLKLKYAKGRYGPYAENLNKVLEALEGHYISGFGDRSQSVLRLDPIEVFDSAVDEADTWLASDTQARDNVERVLATVEGWENAYGLELLGTLLYTVRVDPATSDDFDLLVTAIRSWDERKAKLFPHDHISAAWNHMKTSMWL